MAKGPQGEGVCSTKIIVDFELQNSAIAKVHGDVGEVVVVSML
jgi:hypothetical protein